jgi:GNAT superfamily N-acetyltransferase
MNYAVQRDDLTISADPARLDMDGIYAFLSQTYWARERAREVLEKAIRNSCSFGLYREKEQIGFARVVTDYATYGYLADVYVLEAYRGRGLARWLVQSILAHPELKHLRRWALVTKDAHKLYRDCGFTELQHPEDHMQKLQPHLKPGELG